MSYVQLILNKRRKAQTATPSASPSVIEIDLPGLHRRENYKNTAEKEQKKEYNRLLHDCQALNKVVNRKKGEEKKETRAQINRHKAAMKSLLGKIGMYTPSEEAMGFKEDGDGF